MVWGFWCEIITHRNKYVHNYIIEFCILPCCWVTITKNNIHVQKSKSFEAFLFTQSKTHRIIYTMTSDSYLAPHYLLLFVGLSFLLYNDHQVLVTLLLELCHLCLRVLQLDRHLLHFLSRVVNLTQTVPQFVGCSSQLVLLVKQQPKKSGQT